VENEIIRKRRILVCGHAQYAQIRIGEPSLRFCSPILMHHDADGKELGEFSGFSNADFRGKMDDRGICDFSP